MRKYYSEYIRHCLKFFVRHPKPKFKTTADKLNWEACESAFRKLTNEERELIVEIYQGGDTIPDNVYQLSKRRKLDQDYIWRLITSLEQTVAKRRGLL